MIGKGFATLQLLVLSSVPTIQLGPLRNWMTIVAWGIGHEMKTPVARVAAVPGRGRARSGNLNRTSIIFHRKAFCGLQGVFGACFPS